MTKGHIACSVVINDWMIPFAAHTAARDSHCFSMDWTIFKIAPSRPLSNTWILWRTRVTPKRHLDRFSRFCRAHKRDQQTDRHTDRPRYSVCSNSPHLMQCMRCNLKTDQRVCKRSGVDDVPGRGRVVDSGQWSLAVQLMIRSACRCVETSAIVNENVCRRDRRGTASSATVVVRPSMAAPSSGEMS